VGFDTQGRSARIENEPQSDNYEAFFAGQHNTRQTRGAL
jgi:hypothetical protein